MFHRVKSEDAEQNATTPTAKAGEPANESIEKKEETKPEIVQAETDKKQDVTEQKSQQEKKEAKPMSQAETATEEKTEAQIDIPSSAYQRAGTAPASASGYPGSAATAPASYPGYGAANTQAAAGDRRLTIGAGITMSGEIEACDYLLVEGTVEAALKGASVLDIAETGVFYGTVEIEDATIAGRFEGDITAQGRLVLREGATVTGTIAYKELEIEAGAIIDGKLTPLSGVAKSEKPAPSTTAKKEAKPAGKPQKAQSEKAPEPANNDGGLFSKAATAAE